MALNKIDQIPESERQVKIDKMIKRIRKTLESTKFRDSPIVPVSANLNSSTDMYASAEPGLADTLNLDLLLSAISSQVTVPVRSELDPFLCEVDHCFSIKGSGTIMTGTILKGMVKVGDVKSLNGVELDGMELSLTSLLHLDY